jgi:hypothetical protein
MFDKLKKEDKQHLYGETAMQKKLKFFHGHLSSHQVEKSRGRPESALLPTNSSLFDQEYQNGVPALTTEACKERILLSKLDLCVDKAHLLKRRAQLDDDCLFKDDTTKVNPYDSDIFHQQIPNQPKIHTMKRNQTEKK